MIWGNKYQVKHLKSISHGHYLANYKLSIIVFEYYFAKLNNICFFLMLYT